MAKKKLSTQQKIEKYKRKRRIGLTVKIIIAAIIVALMIPATYYGYYYVVFSVLPARSYDPDKITGVGYCRPLHMIPKDNTESTFVLAYYYNGCWNVVDDSQKLKDNRENFMIYKEDDKWHEETHLQLMLIKDTYMFNNIPLCEKMLIDNRCFKDCTKKMTMEEFEQYVSEHGYTSVYIQ